METGDQGGELVPSETILRRSERPFGHLRSCCKQ